MGILESFGLSLIPLSTALAFMHFAEVALCITMHFISFLFPGNQTH